MFTEVGVATKVWFGRREVAEMVGLTADVLDKRIRPLMEDGARGDGRKLELHVPSVVRAMVLDAERRAAPPLSLDDPLLAGGDSPALERYRAAKADLAELELATKRKELMPTAAVLETVQAFTMPLVGLIQRWERRLRTEEAQELRSAIERGLKRIEGLKPKAAKRDAASQN